MKTAFSTLACPDWGWEKIIDEASRLGYDGIELRSLERELDFGRMKPFFEENIENTIRQLRERNLEVCCLDTSCRFHDEKSFDKYLKEGKASIDLANKLNCKFIRVCGDDIPDKEKEDEIIERIAAGIDELVNYAKGKGVTVLVETHGKFSCGNAMMKLLRHITGKEIGVLWDVTNAYIDYGEPTEETFNSLREYIRHTHIKDAKGKHPNASLCMVGEGDLSIAQMIDLLKSADYDGWVSLEWEKMWHPELEEPEVVLDVYIKHMRPLLK